MSFCNFFTDSTGGDHKIYQRRDFSYETEIVGSSNAFAGTVRVDNDDGNKKNVIIDATVKVSTVSDKVLKDCRNFWKRMIAGAVLTCVATALLSVAVIGAGLALGVFCPPLVEVACVVILLGLCLIGLPIFSGFRTKSAIKELRFWTDPLKKIIMRRQQIPNKEFEKVITKDKYKNLLSDEEAKKLWDKSKSCYSADQILKSQDLKRFLSTEELSQLWEENKSNYTLKDISRSPELKKCASDEDMREFWAKEIKQSKIEGDSLKNSGKRKQGRFVRALHERGLLSTDNFPKIFNSSFNSVCREQGFIKEILEFNRCCGEIKLGNCMGYWFNFVQRVA